MSAIRLTRELHLYRKLLSGREFRKVKWGRLVPADVSPVDAKTSRLMGQDW